MQNAKCRNLLARDGRLKDLPVVEPDPMKGSVHDKLSVDCVTCAVITVSDTRTIETDNSGLRIVALLECGGHKVLSREIIRDDPRQIRDRVSAAVRSKGVDAILISGGTGIASRDTTYEAIESLFDKRLDGFGELFRQLSYEQIGAAAMLSRADRKSVV